MVLPQDDLTTPSGGLFGHRRHFANQMQTGGSPTNYRGPNGYNWYVSQLPYAATPDNGATVAVFYDPNNPYWFTKSGSTYSPMFANLNPLNASLVDNGTYFIFTQTDGGKTRVSLFYNFTSGVPGAFVSYTDERGITTTATTTSGVITELIRSYTVGSTTTYESLQYSYFTSGIANGLLQTVTYSKRVGSGAWTNLKQVSFAYYGLSDPNGNPNDLMSATQQIWDGSSWNDVAVDYYRYYLLTLRNSFHGLKSHFGPEACRLMFNAGINLSTASDSSIQQYADHIYQYGPTQAAIAETSAVCPSCPGGGTTFDSFFYETSGNSNGFNSWSNKTAQLLPDSSQKIVYTNWASAPMLEVVIDPTGANMWGTFYRYDPTSGLLIWKAMPSAVNLPASLATLEANADLLQYNTGTGLYTYLNNSAGLIEVTAYYTSTGSGGVAGYKQYDQVQQGQTGTPVTVREYTYTSNTAAGFGTVYPIASVTEYPVAGSTSTAYTTSYAYLFYAGTNQVSQKTTTWPVVAAGSGSGGQNGSGSADSIVEQFDSCGNRTQLTDERGIVNTYTFDPVMSAVTTQVLNYVSGSSGPGINVTTNFTYDDFGRILTAIGDSHTVVISGTATSVQPVTSYAYSQSVQPMSGTWVPDQNTMAKGYYDGTNYTLIDPVTVMNLDKDGRTVDNITSHRTAGSSGLLSPTETFAQTDWQTWTSTQYSSSHQTISTRTYFLIPSSGAGTLGTNYSETDYGYDILERRNRVAVWGSASLATITRTIWTTPQRAASTWVGTDDSGATDSNPAGTNSVQFVQVAGQAGFVGVVSVTLPNNITVGNTLVAVACVNAPSAPASTEITDSLGNTWTLVASQAGASATAGGAGIWVCNITTGGTITVTFTTGAVLCGLAVAEYSGVAAASPLDTSASATNATGSTTPASGNMTTANAGDLIFSTALSYDVPLSWTAGAGGILRPNDGAVIQEQLVTATGTYDAAFTTGASIPWTVVGVALKSTPPSGTNNMVIVSSNVYDGGSAGGDGNLTQRTQYVSATTGDTRVTNWGFDFRDRKVNMTDATSRYTVWTLDNLDRQTQTQLYATSTGNLAAQSGVNFDARGRVYQTTTTAVDPTTGTPGNTLTGNMWYDPSGNLVQQIAPGAGQVFNKSAYNGVNWTTATYTGYNTTGVSYSQAQTVSGDIVIEQAQNTFDEVGTAVSVASFQRLNDASTSTTGALTSSIARIMYTAVWSDGIDRQIALANYEAASSFTRPSTPPSTGSTVLVSATSYDEAGRVYQTTDPKSIVNQRTYDNASRTTQTIEDVAGLARTTNYTYTLDNLIATMTAVNSTTGNQTTAWAYGTVIGMSQIARADLLASITFPDSGVVSLRYNGLGQVRFLFDQRGNERGFFYDGLGRITSDHIQRAGSDTDLTVRRIEWAYEIRGMVSTVTSFDSDSGGTTLNQVLLNYNTFAQLSQEYQEHSGAVNTSTSVSVQYAYDSGGSGSNEIRLNQLTYPNARTIAYYFGTSGGMNDLLNRVDTIQDTTSGTTDLASYIYLGLGTVVRISYPQPSVWLDLWGGTSGVFAGLDLFNRVIDQRWQNNTGGTPVDIDRYKYGYDFNSNRNWKANVVGTANVAAGLDEYYTMDNLNRLTDMQRGVLNGTNTGITGTIAREMTYGLDPTGNWSTYVTATAGTADLNQGRASNTVNEITSITESGGTPLWVTPAYDAAGNMTTMPQPGTPTSSFTATYDAWNRMTGVDSGGSPIGQYTYDGRNRRIVSVTTQTRHFYFSSSWQDIEQRVDSATTMDQQHVWGIRYIDELVCRDDATPERLYATQDANFNVTSICNTGGAAQERYAFEPYGSRTVMDGTWTVLASSAYAWSVGHQGLYHDPASGAINNRNRYFHTNLGTFLTRDPSGYRNGNGLYLYMDANPTGSLDPTGLYTVCCDTVQGTGPETLFEHCELDAGPCPSGRSWVSYAVSVDKSKGRSLYDKNGACLKSCADATPQDISDCVSKSFPYKAAPLPGGAGGSQCDGGEWGNNCQTSTLQTLSACCLQTNWQPDAYAGSNTPCLSGHVGTRLVAMSGPNAGASAEVKTWICDVEGPNPIIPPPPLPAPPPIPNEGAVKWSQNFSY